MGSNTILRNLFIGNKGKGMCPSGLIIGLAWTLLHHLLPNDSEQSQIKLNSVFKNGVWHWDALQYQLSTEYKNRISSLSINLNSNKDDLAIWTGISTRISSTSSAC